jgi:hypothetical protein
MGPRRYFWWLDLLTRNRSRAQDPKDGTREHKEVKGEERPDKSSRKELKMQFYTRRLEQLGDNDLSRGHILPGELD